MARLTRAELYWRSVLFHRLADHDDRPSEDKIVVLRNVTWADYQRVLEMRGDHSAPRIAFLQGDLEIMTPSQPHESLKSRIGQLVEVWCLEHAIEFNTYGSWTLEDKDVERGAEPDECYVFGDLRETRRPDLAIEVVWTSGGLDKLDIYRKLGVHEVWFWRRGHLTVHALRGDTYQDIPSSEILPGIDLVDLAAHLDRPTASQAIREYRARVQQRR
jgi:Uma2 family endonuclease